MDKKNGLITAAVVVVIAAVSISAVAMDKADDNMADMNMDMPSTSMTESNSEMTSMSSNDGVQETNQVTYKNFEVAQKTIKVKKGTTVTWTNEDNAKHDVTFTEDYPGLMSTELFGKGESKSITFNTVGTFSYICSPHPYMKGTVEVVE